MSRARAKHNVSNLKHRMNCAREHVVNIGYLFFLYLFSSFLVATEAMKLVHRNEVPDVASAPSNSWHRGPTFTAGNSPPETVQS